MGSIGFAINIEKFDQLNINPPKSWSELADEKYRNLITLPNPVSSGTGYTIISTIIQKYGSEKGISLLKKIHQNVREYSNSGAMASKLAALGFSAIGISFTQDIQRLIQEGYPLKLIIPNEGTGYEIGGLAIVKGSQHLEEAKDFIDFMLSKKGQNLYAAMNEYRLPTNQFATIPEGAIPFNKINLIDYNLEWSSLNQKKLVKIWLKDIYLTGE